MGEDNSKPPKIDVEALEKMANRLAPHTKAELQLVQAGILPCTSITTIKMGTEIITVTA